MIKFLRLLLALIGLVVVVVLSVDNRQIVDLNFWPMPFTYQLPLYAVFLIGLIGGAILGGLAVWLASLGQRAEARTMRRRVRAVEYQERLKRERDEAEIVEEARRKTQALALAAPRA